MINKKKEGGFYASKVRLFLNEYDGIPLEEFCKAEEQQFAVLSSRVSSAEREKHEAQKKARLLEQQKNKYAKDQLVNLVAHKWQPQMAPAIY